MYCSFMLSVESSKSCWIVAIKVGTIVLGSVFLIIPLMKNQWQYLICGKKRVASDSTVKIIMEYAHSVYEMV